MENKKAQTTIGALPNSIIAIVVAIIILVVGLVIIQEIRDVDVLTRSETLTFANDALTTVTYSGEMLTCGKYPAGQCGPVNSVRNTTGTGTPIIAAGNYTQSNCRLSYSSTSAEFNNTDWSVNYSCTAGGEAYKSANSSLIAIGDFADFVPLIIIALAAAIVIGLILASFVMRRRER